MCKQIQCRECGKPTWAGCGAHIEQVMGAVPPEARCKCREKGGAGKGDNKPRKRFLFF